MRRSSWLARRRFPALPCVGSMGVPHWCWQKKEGDKGMCRMAHGYRELFGFSRYARLPMVCRSCKSAHRLQWLLCGPVWLCPWPSSLTGLLNNSRRDFLVILWSQATCSRWPWLTSGCGICDLQRSLLASTITWFCNLGIFGYSHLISELSYFSWYCS